jgi:hypothetical protein
LIVFVNNLNLSIRGFFMDRVTEKKLQAICERINIATNMPLQPYTDIDGKLTPQAGCYHLSHAYGGVALHRMSLTPGCSGVTEPLHTGHVPKRQLADMMYAFCYGLEAARERAV